ncbi:hypothetical protein QM012_007570 [Aureobasidium pullulans]|uniref:Peptidase A1 domain-containing protein n=1 Tax=Aureobasidium pullulans TaxID=5580 RepID=A0ABR0TNA8_AURPU
MGIPLSTPDVGASFSSPQLGDGPVVVSDPHTIGPFVSAFTVDPSDTNSFGFSASMTSMDTVIQAQYTDTANVVKTATCSAQINSYGTNAGLIFDLGSGTVTTLLNPGTNSDLAYGSILCPIANTQIGTGPLILSLTNDEDGPLFSSPSTYAFNRDFHGIRNDRDRRNHYNTVGRISRISLCKFANLLADDSLDVDKELFLVLKCQSVDKKHVQLCLLFGCLNLAPRFLNDDFECAIVSSNTIEFKFYAEEVELRVIQ